MVDGVARLDYAPLLAVGSIGESVMRLTLRSRRAQRKGFLYYLSIARGDCMMWAHPSSQSTPPSSSSSNDGIRSSNDFNPNRLICLSTSILYCCWNAALKSFSGRLRSSSVSSVRMFVAIFFSKSSSSDESSSPPK
mmetsp:Transcript_22821/g.35070  ORF Transcript_22821/g.35070 Transcript_22821/m.35070 type:complete len:136 (-) Transcript_22821:661-1068(-)